MTDRDTPVVVYWIRRCFRLEDNPVLNAAILANKPILAIYCHAPEEETPWQHGAASNWWLHQSIKAFSESLQARGVALHLFKGSPEGILSQLDFNIQLVYCDALIEPALKVQTHRVEKALKEKGVGLKAINASLLLNLETLFNKSGKPYQVYTPFSKCGFEQVDLLPVQVIPKQLPSLNTPLEGEVTLDSLGLLPQLNWADGFSTYWTPGEAGAKTRLGQFVLDAIEQYPTNRERPDIDGISKLSPHWHFGEISPQTIWQAVLTKQLAQPKTAAACHSYLRQLLWREFAHYLLIHYPKTPLEPLNTKFEKFPWQENEAYLNAWQMGQTGIPIVDAGMRELWATGWMHNRVRMIVASYLTKNLLQPWQDGARWFWDTLVDADLPNNTMGWQWVAGCGADASPYFRIFNPVLQAQKFDPKGEYIARWVPELRGVPLPARFLPNTAATLLSTNYPTTLVDLGESRRCALEAYSRLKSPSTP